MNRVPQIPRLLAGMALTLPAVGVAEDTRTTRGQVEQVQRVQVEGFESEFLILELDDGSAFQLPDADAISAGQGVKVEVEALPVTSPGELPVACRVRVLAVPLEREGEDYMQEAANPFEVYHDPGCTDHSEPAAPNST